MTALIGPSGGGKSTAAKLAVRFWDVERGRITVGGVGAALGSVFSGMVRDAVQPAGQKFCSGCGAAMRMDDAFCSKCGKPAGGGAFCPKCGAAVQPGSAFCAKCGQALGDSRS